MDEAIISQAYPIFEVKNEKELLPEYLMMWFTRSEFDREACFHAVGGVRGSLEWEDFENLQLPIPHPDKQKEIEKFEIIIPKSDLLEKFESLMQKLFLEKDLKSFENQKLSELKDLLLSKLATIEN